MPEVVAAKPREGKFNKNAARRVRVAGKIPAVLYGPGHDPVAIEVDPKQISRILFSETGHNTIFDVEVAGQPTAKAMIVDWQREPHQRPIDPHRPQAHCPRQGSPRQGARQAARDSDRRQDFRRHSRPGVARSRDRVLAGGYSRNIDVDVSNLEMFGTCASPICRTRTRSSTSTPKTPPWPTWSPFAKKRLRCRG